MFNKKGVADVVIVSWILIAGIIGATVGSTAQSGKLQNNSKRIWCKMQNKGADFCDAMYK